MNYVGKKILGLPRSYGGTGMSLSLEKFVAKGQMLPGKRSRLKRKARWNPVWRRSTPEEEGLSSQDQCG